MGIVVMNERDAEGGKNLTLRLNTLPNVKRSYARIMRLYARGEIDRELFRDLCYGFTGFLGYWRLEADQEIIARMQDIEERLENLEKTGGKQ